MKMKGNWLFLTASLVLAIPLVLMSVDSGAVNYKGDGALPNGSGGWAQPAVTTEITCLECHGSGANHYQCEGFCPDPTNVRDKSSYLMTGHKNMLRKVAPGSPWAGADGTLYGTTDDFYGSGSIYNWTTGTIQVGPGHPTEAGLTEPLYYIFGGWIDRGQLNTIFDGGFTGEQFPNGNYDCARCHTTGYQFDATGLEPTTYNGSPITDAQFSRVPTSGSSTTSSWYLTAVQCERCHRDVANEAGGHNCYLGGVYNPTYTSYSACTGAGGTWTVIKPTFESATKVCIECHRQESLDSGNNIVLSTDLEVSDAGPPYSPFFDASIGQAFLNSPHARFSGTMALAAQNSPDLSVSTTGTYDSNFKDPVSGKNLGCAGCHDVHQSIVTAVGAAQPISRGCVNCHTTPGDPDQTATPKVVPANMNHPMGAGTPFQNGVAESCAVCHMAGYHFFRINVSAGYSTFPTEAQFTSGQTTANTASDGKLTGAVWVDLDLACGQCHGGSAGPTAVAPNAFYIPKASLAGAANGIHGSGNSTPPYPTTHNNPVAAGTLTPSSGTTSTLFTLNTTGSSADTINGTAPAAFVNWGDGSAMATGAVSVSFTHTYQNNATYTVTLVVKDALGYNSKGSYTATVASVATLSTAALTVATSPALAGVNIYVKTTAGITKGSCVATASGSCSFNLAPSTGYKVYLYKTSETFTPANGTVQTTGIAGSTTTATYTYAP